MRFADGRTQLTVPASVGGIPVPHLPPRARLAVVIATALLGMFATIGAFLLVCSWEYRLAEIDFHSRARSSLEVVNADLDDARTLLYTIAAFISASDHPVTAQEFASFSKSLHRRTPGLRDTGWAPRVTLGERRKFERDVRATGRANFEIKQFGPGHRLVRAGPRPEYYALLYAEAHASVNSLFGFDLVSEQARSRAAHHAVAVGGPSATPPIDVATVKRPGAGVLAYMPVYDSSDDRARRHVRGLVLGVFDVSKMVRNILAKETTLRGLDLYVYNPAERGARRVIYQSTSADGAPVSERDLLAGAHVSAAVKLIDQSIETIVTPALPLRPLRMSLFATVTLVVGFTMTVMIVAYLLLALRRTLELEALTSSLQATTQMLVDKAEQITQISRQDALTGMPNRLMLQERMAEAVALLERGTPFALLFLDLDRFKAVNDTLGHAAGDRLLCAVTERIRGAIRDGDTAARLGGDEFAVLLAGAAQSATVVDVASRLIESISRPYYFDEHPVNIGVSIGAALATAGVTPASIMAQADLAMYTAKEAGHGVLRLYEPRMRIEVDARRTLELDLRRGLERDEFEVHYQPSMRLDQGVVACFEALVRWRHPQHGLLLPDQFLRAAEECGLIGSLGEWVLRTACRDAAAWPRPVNVAVNISPVQLDDALLADKIHAALAASGLSPERLEIEVTEDAVLNRGEATVKLFEELHRIGIAIAFDDFGTGFSSLSSFVHLPFDKIKIDRSFVERIDTSPGAAAIVSAIAGLGLRLNIATTAEGVETIEQLDYLRDVGCIEAQGFYFSPARPNAEVPSLLCALDRNSQQSLRALA